jgi:X-X-X-Leu-X-X-Gly heptad repeat protein
LAVEIKLRMNWSKALQAGAEFRRFLQSTEAKAHPVRGAIVFFEAFEGAGWHKKAKSRLLENGWNHWYASHCDVEGYRADLFRLCGGKFESYGQAMGDALLAKLPELSEKDQAKLAEGLQRLKNGSAEITTG